ncbi:Serine/threonine protein kinase [Lentzea xinjiangensis]|uniref:non-specific serine/threonine protein kinase n=1 Tax=Lentzea xinjiangensis TaxID=402600 RepID=A0A1H9D800_9PSEU|nr:protein kinase family protein [Lentzea xinjiangensis]SEQ09595.1 Serine/threonine protein kinase [Lentzea xinjiangensis]
MADPVELMLGDLTDKYAQEPVSDAFIRLYTDDQRFGRTFASLHERLNDHFAAINDRARSTRHYWADSSREFISLIDELAETVGTLRRAGFEVAFREEYNAAVKQCKPWLSTSGGSTVPENFEPIEVVRYEPVFTRPETAVKLKKQITSVQLQMVGQGSYANVYSFVDPDYGIKVAVKRAKKDLNERDLYRFKQEFDIMKRLSFPYVVEVYRYDDERNEYKMEFCDETLRNYIRKRNSSLGFATRKRVALQFLYGIGYIHTQDLLHRDISLQNVLLKVYESKAVLVKLSDFGLAKDRASEFTHTKTEMRGTIRDPTLSSFKDYDIPNEIYSVGWVLSYIFTGKESLPRPNSDAVTKIVRKCTDSDIEQRYSSIREIIADIDRLESFPGEYRAEPENAPSPQRQR